MIKPAYGYRIDYRGRSVVRPDGTVVSTPPHPGLLERLIPATVRAAPVPLTILTTVIVGGVAGWFAILLWGRWRMHKLRHAQIMSVERRVQSL